jgi:hypothetical protein
LYNFGAFYKFIQRTYYVIKYTGNSPSCCPLYSKVFLSVIYTVLCSVDFPGNITYFSPVIRLYCTYIGIYVEIVSVQWTPVQIFHHVLLDISPILCFLECFSAGSVTNVPTANPPPRPSIPLLEGSKASILMDKNLLGKFLLKE